MGKIKRTFEFCPTLCYHLILIVITAFLLLPSVASAVMRTLLFLPSFLVLTTPFEFTTAYLGLELVHTSFLFAFLPVVLTIGFIVPLPPLLLFLTRSLAAPPAAALESEPLSEAGTADASAYLQSFCILLYSS